MEILIFDMDGVLLEAIGYHRALQDTVRIAGEHLSLPNIELTQNQINKFEAIGISSEWHSSALCMAYLQVQVLSGNSSPVLDLNELFYLLEQQSIGLPSLQRGLAAFEILCKNRGIDISTVRSTIMESEDINHSKTMQWFQELVLGSENYQNRYQKPGRNDNQSYLEMFDVPILAPKNADLINHWANNNGRGAAVMTNRPSSGPSGFFGSPEAELGLELVQLPEIPLIGYGDISWLATRINSSPSALAKPNATHALAAILSALHIGKHKSLEYSRLEPAEWHQETLHKLQGGTISVFEDTPGGIISIQKAGKILSKAGVNVNIRAIGIATEKSKINALEVQGARVYPDINSALADIEYF
jgi:hypothetical protein